MFNNVVGMPAECLSHVLSVQCFRLGVFAQSCNQFPPIVTTAVLCDPGSSCAAAGRRHRSALLVTAGEMAAVEHYDCLIIGAGISGLDAAYYLQQVHSTMQCEMQT